MQISYLYLSNTCPSEDSVSFPLILQFYICFSYPSITTSHLQVSQLFLHILGTHGHSIQSHQLIMKSFDLAGGTPSAVLPDVYSQSHWPYVRWPEYKSVFFPRNGGIFLANFRFKTTCKAPTKIMLCRDYFSAVVYPRDPSLYFG